MTDEHRIDKLEERVDRIESDLWQELKEIKGLLQSIQLTAAKTMCPAPGTCIDLKDRLVRLEGTHDTVAKTVADLIRWRAWLTGINLVISTLSLGALTIIGKYIVDHL